MAHIESRPNVINDWHASEHGAEGQGGAMYGGPTGFADMFSVNDLQELQILKRRLFP